MLNRSSRVLELSHHTRGGTEPNTFYSTAPEHVGFRRKDHLTSSGNIINLSVRCHVTSNPFTRLRGAALCLQFWFYQHVETLLHPLGQLAPISLMIHVKSCEKTMSSDCPPLSPTCSPQSPAKRFQRFRENQQKPR